MHRTFSFQFTLLDADRLHSQVSLALEKRTEHLSRDQFPKRWELIDKLNSVEKQTPAVLEKRRRRRILWGLAEWLLGLCWLIPALMEPHLPWFSVAVGVVGYLSGVVTLWSAQRTLLGILSLIQGVFFCFGALANAEELGSLLLPGIAGLIWGLASLLSRRRGRMTDFDRAAAKLLQMLSSRQGFEQIRLAFDEDGMHTFRPDAPDAGQTVPYAALERVLETDDLLLVAYDDAAIVLQKHDLRTGSIPELREFLRERTAYVVCSPPEAPAEGMQQADKG